MKLARPLQWLHGIHGQLGEKQSLEITLLYPQPTSQGFQAIFQGEMTGWLMIEGLQGPGYVAVSFTAIPSTSQGMVQNGRGRQRLNLGGIFSPNVVNEDNELENKKPI